MSLVDSQSLGVRAMVAPVFLVPILSEAVQRKVDLRSLFRGLEIAAADFDEPGLFVSHRQAVTIVRRALRLLPVAELGLVLGQHITITERGILALGLLAAPTLGDAISLSVQFPRSAGYLMQVREEPSADGRDFIAEPFSGDDDLQRFLVDLTFSATVKLRREATSANYSPAAVDFVYKQPDNSEAYAAFFGGRVRFGCLRNKLTTDHDWLGFRLPWASAMACRLSTQLLERESERLNSMPAVGFTVERAIRRQLPEIADLGEVAASLNLSERTLRRQLAQEGLSYRHLLDESRKSRALALITTGNWSVAKVAAAAGFSDARAFTRAFKRWTGHPPSLIRGYVAVGLDNPAPGLG